MFSIVNIMKAIACLLIANFHSDLTFPDHLSILAFGGDLGNNFFFLISGFTIWPSVKRSVHEGAFGWYKKRFLRIMPMVGAFYFAELLAGNVIIDSLSSVVHYFIFPTLYWFTGAILVMYVAFYFVEKKITSKTLRIGIAEALIVLHLIFDGLAAERYLIGFLAMMVGCELRRNTDNMTKNTDHSNYLLCVTALLAVTYCVFKLLRAKGIEFFGLIHLGIGLLTVMIGVLLLVWGLKNEGYLTKIFPKNGNLWKFIQTISEITMAVYLTMGFADRVLMKGFIDIMPFPLSYIVNLMVSFAIAYGITKVDKMLQKRIGER